MEQTSQTSQTSHPPSHMPFSPSMPFASGSSAASIYPPGASMGHTAPAGTHNRAHPHASHLPSHMHPHARAHPFFPDTSTFPFQNLEHVLPTDHVERGRTGPALPGQTIKARAHPYSRSPSRATASRDPSRNPASRDPSRNPASRDSSAHRDPGSAGTGGPSTPPRSGRAGVKRRQKYSRTRTGCLCCRARRIKCDEERPVCRRCVIAKKQCQYPDEGSASVSRGNSREDYERGGKSSRSNSGDPDDRKALNPDGSSDIQGIPPQSAAYHDPFNLALSPYANKNAVPDPAEYTFDQPFVGTYDDSAPSASTSALGAAGAADNADGVQEGNITVAGIQQKYASAGGAPMLATPNFLLPWFPTQEERSLILHYCANAADLMMAIPSGLNPMLAINLPLALDSPRGANPAADALRVALLGIGAIHQAFLLARSGVSTTQTTAMFQYASNLRDMGKELVRRAVAEPSGARSDAALGAATALGTIDIFFGGEGWVDNFNVAKEMVAYRGGPAAMLKASKPKQLAEGVTISPARLMLEILAIYDTFGSLATGEEPSFLGDHNESWWFEGSQSTYEEHSVEKQFGMSRVMVHLFARLTRLVARVDRSDVAITESDAQGDMHMPSGSEGERPPTPTTAWLSSLMKASGSVLPIVAEARKLNADVDAWIDSLQLSTLEHERVQVGNRAYAFAMKILLLRRVFKYPRDDLRVQSAANEVLRHCSTSTAILGMSIDLMWPAIIAGCCVEGDARQWLLTLLEGFKSQCCFDVETASRIIQESWRRVDAKDPRDDWKEVCEDFGLKVLLC